MPGPWGQPLWLVNYKAGAPPVLLCGVGRGRVRITAHAPLSLLAIVFPVYSGLAFNVSECNAFLSVNIS